MVSKSPYRKRKVFEYHWNSHFQTILVESDLGRRNKTWLPQQTSRLRQENSVQSNGCAFESVANALANYKALGTLKSLTMPSALWAAPGVLGAAR